MFVEAVELRLGPYLVQVTENAHPNTKAWEPKRRSLVVEGRGRGKEVFELAQFDKRPELVAQEQPPFWPSAP